jgi:hypothetical protein
VVTPYIAEFWNTLSNIPPLLLGAFGFIATLQNIRKRKRVHCGFLVGCVEMLAHSGAVLPSVLTRRSVGFCATATLYWLSFSLEVLHFMQH